MANGILGMPSGILSQEQATQMMGASNDQARNRALSSGAVAAGAGLLSAPNLREGLAQGLTGFNRGYNTELIANKPKVTPLAGGAFSQISFPDGRVEIVSNEDVQKFQQSQNQANMLGKVELAQIAAGTKTSGVIEKAALEQAGDVAGARSGVNALRTVAKDLITGTDNQGKPIFRNDISGPWMSLLPDSVRKRVLSDSAEMQKRAESVIQSSLKATLGSQFTQAEGDRFLARAYDPALTEEQNYRRLVEVADELDAITNAKEEAVNYFRTNKTLEGFVPQGATFTSRNQPPPVQGNAVTPQANSVATPLGPQTNGAVAPPATIQSDTDYNALPSGTIFIGPDGKRRQKP